MQGSNSGLPPSLACATYRILQEALTNAARHGTGTARLRLAYEPRAVSITVTNRAGTLDGQCRPGHGIVGMTERATLLGGTLTAGMQDGTFTVRAWLPHDRNHDRSQDRSLDRSHDRSLDRSHDRSLDRSHDPSLDRSHDRSLDRIHDPSDDPSHDPSRDRSPAR